MSRKRELKDKVNWFIANKTTMDGDTRADVLEQIELGDVDVIPYNARIDSLLDYINARIRSKRKALAA